MPNTTPVDALEELLDILKDRCPRVGNIRLRDGEGTVLDQVHSSKRALASDVQACDLDLKYNL